MCSLPRRLPRRLAAHQTVPALPLTSHQPAFVLLCEFVLPDAQDPPAGLAEGAGDEPVADLVCGQFLPPERGVVAWFGTVLRTPVPETAVHEDRQAVAAKDEVRLPENGLIPPPAKNPSPAENEDEGQFGAAVAASPHAGHNLRTLCLGEDVCHKVTANGQPTLRYGLGFLVLV